MAQYYGELAALLTAVFWTVTALAFESASRKVGSLSVNLLRLTVAFILLSVYAWISRGKAFPVDAGEHQWIWLSLSGLVGFVLGDLFLFQSYVVIGSRISMLIMSLAPPMAAVIGWLTLGETLRPMQAVAMAVVLAGIVLVVLERQTPDENGNGKRVKFSYPLSGILLAFGGALGQAGGLVLSKFGMANYGVIPSVQIRVITGILGFTLFFTFSNRWQNLYDAVRNVKAMKRLMVGAFFGPFLGVSFSLLAVKHTSTGVASALMSIVPVLIIAPAVIVFKEKITTKELIGAIITVVGVAIFFL